jgi:hypothetical protein
MMAFCLAAALDAFNIKHKLLGACVAFSCPTFLLVKEEAHWFVHLNSVCICPVSVWPLM